MVRRVNGVWKRCAVLALAGWWVVSLTFAPLLHRHAAELIGASCGPICLGLPDASPSSDACHVGLKHSRHVGGALSAGTSDVDGPGLRSAAPSRQYLDAAHCHVCHFLSQGQDRAPLGCWVPRKALIGWNLVLDDAPGGFSLRLSHYSRGPPAGA